MFNNSLISHLPFPAGSAFYPLFFQPFLLSAGHQRLNTDFGILVVTHYINVYVSQFSHLHPTQWDFSTLSLPSSHAQHVVQSAGESSGSKALQCVQGIFLNCIHVIVNKAYEILINFPVLLSSSAKKSIFFQLPLYDPQFSFPSSEESWGEKFFRFFLRILQD